MSKRVVVAVCVLVTVPAVAAAVPITALDVSPVRTYEGKSTVNNVHVESRTVHYDGSTAYEVVVVANSSRTVDINAVVTVSLETLNGRAVSDGMSTKLLRATGTQKYTVDVTPNVTRDQFTTVNVTVSQ